jgi:DNA mismatch endonuclease (patch repair protein)
VTDVVDKEIRSRMMSGIRGQDTHPEILVRTLLHASGFRFRLHVKNLPGKPDIVLPKYKAVVLVHGCFWHGHGCRFFKWPTTRAEFWRAKIERNRENDEKAVSALVAGGWRVAIVWECALRTPKMDRDALRHALSHWFKGNDARLELRE